MEKGQLGPDQTGALGPSGEAGKEFRGRGGVHEHPDAAAVGRLGRQGAVGDLSLARACAIIRGRAGELRVRGGRLEDHGSLAAVHDDLRSVCDVEQLPTREHRHGNAERARHDCRVRRDSASGQGDSREPLAVLSHVRGPQVLRHEDERRAVGRWFVVRNAGGDARGAPPEGAHVVGPRSQHGVRQRSDQRGVLLGCLDQGSGSPDTALDHRLRDRRAEHRVSGHERPGLDDLGVVVASLFPELAGDALELCGRLSQGGTGTLGFRFGVSA